MQNEGPYAATEEWTVNQQQKSTAQCADFKQRVDC